MVSLVKDNMSKEYAMKFSSENGNSSKVKYKRRNVSAVRDFPPGCGPDVARTNVNAHAITEIERVNVEVVDVLVGTTNIHQEITETERVNVEVVDASVGTANMHQKSTETERVNVELVDALVGTANIPQETTETEKVNMEVVDALVDKTKIPQETTGTERMYVEVTDETTKMVDEITRVFETGMQHLETSLPEMSSEDPKDTNNDDMDMVMEMIMELTKEDTQTLEEQESLPINDVDIPVSTIRARNKYTPRKVSATRDFPPFCGINAPVPTEEDRVKITSRKKSLSVVKKTGTTCGVFPEAQKDAIVASTAMQTAIADGKTLEAKDLHRQQDKSSRREMLGNVKMSVDDSDCHEGETRRVIVQALMAVSSYASGPKERPASSSKEIVVYQQDRSPKRKLSACEIDLGDGLDRAANGSLDRKKWTANGMGKSKAKKSNFSGRDKHVYESERGMVRKKAKKSIPVQKDDNGNLYDNVRREDKDFGEKVEDPPASWALHEFEVSLPPYGPKSLSHDMRNKVRETLRLFQAICRKMLQGEEARSRNGEQSKSKGKGIKRIDYEAAKIVKKKGKEVNTDKQILGAVPGVEVGDEFQYRVELAIVGIHRLYQAGIDSIKCPDGDSVAVSIVASGGYADELDNSDVLIYSGQGGLSGKDKQPQDQKLERGNLALKNSIAKKNPVRVIRGSKEIKASESADARSKIVMTYVYDGLYMVERYWQEEGLHGKLVFKFLLKRIPGQPELAWKEVKISTKSKTREGLCVADISEGKEVMPICAVNTLDDEKPPPFTYVTRMIYPDLCNLNLPRGCDCKGGCLDARRCLCVAKNGEIPYNFNGAIVEVKPLVYECGPSCKCPPSCYNRVSQHGVKFQLEIFKTESRGWGVRSLNSITAGSFICEYTGELLEDSEAEQRTGNDEYLFDIGQNYSDCSVGPDADPNSSNVNEDTGFTIDAAQCGNVGRFINHSCSPNLYAQNVLYDHEDKRMPHIMFFAAENIPPLKELTYHYNYAVNQVFDANGEIKMKMCYCGSAQCTGRMY